MNDESTERLIKEYLSKCRVCDECFAETFCILKGLRDSRKPQKRCVDNIKKYFEEQENERDS